MANWIETKVRYEKTLKNGQQKVVSESYLVDSLSFAEAEARITEEISPYMQGEFSVSAVKRTNISEMFITKDSSADKFYKVKVAFIIYDEKTGAEKRSKATFIVKAECLTGAVDEFLKGMCGTMADYEILGIEQTGIVDVFEHIPEKRQNGTEGNKNA